MRLVVFGVLLGWACGDDDDAPMPDGGSAATCASDDDCADGVFCNGDERCDVLSVDADERGCRAGLPPCADDCDESADACSTCADVDGDGHHDARCGGDDCDDFDPSRYPGNTETCDFDDEDCDDATIGARDADGDGATSTACCNGARCGDDCDDQRASVRPGAAEVCDGLDNDCDTTSDEDALVEVWPDFDRDGYGEADAPSELVCLPPSRTATEARDCDDDDEQRNPDVAEACDGVDQDCDGDTDEDTTAPCSRAHGPVDCIAPADGSRPRCIVLDCEPGFWDCDGDPSNGCEADLCSGNTTCGSCTRACRCSGGECGGLTVELSVAGMVTELATGAPIAGAAVVPAPTCQQTSTTTDMAGGWSLSIQGSFQFFTFSADGYLPATSTHQGVSMLRTEVFESWLMDDDVTWDPDARLGTVVVELDDSFVGFPLQLRHPAVPPAPIGELYPARPPFVVEGTEVTLGTGTSDGFVVFTDVLPGVVVVLFDGGVGCGVICDVAPTSPLFVRAGATTHVRFASCGAVCS